MQIPSILSLFRLAIVFYLGLGLGLILGIKLVLDLGLNPLNILFIVKY